MPKNLFSPTQNASRGLCSCLHQEGSVRVDASDLKTQMPQNVVAVVHSRAQKKRVLDELLRHAADAQYNNNYKSAVDSIKIKLYHSYLSRYH